MPAQKTHIVYGIPTCTSVKKGEKWLKEHRIPFESHDLRKQGAHVGRYRKCSPGGNSPHDGT